MGDHAAPRALMRWQTPRITRHGRELGGGGGGIYSKMPNNVPEKVSVMSQMALVISQDVRFSCLGTTLLMSQMAWSTLGGGGVAQGLSIWGGRGPGRKAPGREKILRNKKQPPAQDGG